MFKKIFIVGLAGLALSFWGALAFAGHNSLTATNAAGVLNVTADSDGVVTVPDNDNPTGEVKCWHVLHARGRGYAHLEGQGVVNISTQRNRAAVSAKDNSTGGIGSLLVKNFSQTEVNVRGKGMKIPFPEQDAMLYLGYGQAVIKGDAVNIFLTVYPYGEIKARGKGKADLRGEWRYQVLKVCAEEVDEVEPGPKPKPRPTPIETGEVTEADGEKTVTYGEE